MGDIPTLSDAYSTLSSEDLNRQIDVMTDKYGEIIFRFLDNECERSVLEREFYEKFYNNPVILSEFDSAIEAQRILISEAKVRFVERFNAKQSGNNPLDVLLPVDTMTKL